jgi:hypothetical protein
MLLAAGSSVSFVNTFTVEDRTRTYQSRQSGYSTNPKPRIRIRVKGRYSGPLVPIFDDQFEKALPPEILAELSEASPRAIDRPPVRIPETEEEIQAALIWLKSQGYLQSVAAPSPSPEPAVVPQGPPVVPERAKPAQPESRGGSGIWWLLAVIIGLPLLLARVADNPQSQARPIEVRRALTPSPSAEVRRALPAVPRAIAITSAVSSVSNTQWQPIRMPDGSVVQAAYQGELPSSAALPARGRFIGEEWSTGNTSWIWMTPAGASFPSWVDP